METRRVPVRRNLRGSSDRVETIGSFQYRTTTLANKHGEKPIHCEKRISLFPEYVFSR